MRGGTRINLIKAGMFGVGIIVSTLIGVRTADELPIVMLAPAVLAAVLLAIGLVDRAVFDAPRTALWTAGISAAAILLACGIVAAVKPHLVDMTLPLVAVTGITLVTTRDAKRCEREGA